MKRSAVAQSNASVTIPGTRVVVAGGTQGIGEAVAHRFGKAGAEVWIVGRNEARGNAVVERLKAISQEQKIDPLPTHHFIKADLSLVSETKRVAEDIRARAGPGGVDYLVMSQGGPPNGKYVPTSEGHEQHFAVQILSRFILAYKLALEQKPVVKKGVMSIMAPGKPFRDVDYDDLDLAKAKENGSFGLLSMVSRDSVVVDAFTEEFAQRQPNVVFTHVFPGAVKTNTMRNSNMPWYFIGIASVASLFLGGTAESYADVPFYLLANPQGSAAATKVRFWDENVVKIEAHPKSMEKGNRTTVWEHLTAILGSSPSK